jgi:tetratricopeptide (TPR) repeat protein
MPKQPAELEHILLQAINLYQQGRVQETGELCRNILESVPDEPNALHLLGVVHLMNGDTVGATEYLTGAARVDASNADIFNSLASALRKSGDSEQAEQFYQRAIALDGDSAKSHVNLANLYRGTGSMKQAARHYREALEKDPNHYRALNNLGLTLEALGEPVSALNMYQRAMAASPGNAEPLHNAARLLGNLGEWQASLDSFDKLAESDLENALYQTGRGIALGKLDRMVEAKTAFDIALVLRPGSVDTLIGHAAALCDHNRPDEALEILDPAQNIAPDNADLHSLTGFALMRLDRIDEALIHLDRALLHAPGHPDAWGYRGQALSRLGRHELALEAYDQALSHDPLNLDARHGRAVTRLKLSRLTGGWRDYLARDSMRGVGPELTRVPLPMDLSGKHVTVRGDRNLSHELFFMRFAPMLKVRGASMNYDNAPQLAAMMSRIGIYDEPSASEPDYIVSSGDLPFVIGADAAAGTVRAIPIPVDPGRLKEAGTMLQAAGPGPYIGITWRAETGYPPLEDFAAALAAINGDVILLQDDASQDEIDRFETALGRKITNLTPPDGDPETLLAYMDLLDEYVCMDNINMHLRAARGRSCRALIANDCEFYWMASGSRSPWFPESPLYRQDPNGAWAMSLDWLARDLEAAHGALQSRVGQ